MSSKIEYLLEVFERNKYRHLKGSTEEISAAAFNKSDLSSQAQSIYKGLGGIEAHFPIKHPVWHLEFENFVVQLDEETSFNRFRGITLQSSFYDSFKGINLETYKRFCRQYEPECLKSARHLKLWTDRESEMDYGPSQEAGDLALNGSSKWKQRAFEDLLQDLFSSIFSINLIRISIYENIMINNKLIKLDSLLISRNETNEKYLWSYLKRKVERFNVEF